MTFKKLQADQLFTGHELLNGNQVLIVHENGTVHDVIDKENAGENIQQFSGILSPGFINCHCHLELSHMRGLIPEKTGLVDFVFSIVTQRFFPDEDILAAINVAEEEMLNNGIVAVGDICNNLLTLPQKKKQNLSYYNFVEASGWIPGMAEHRFQRSKECYDAYSISHPASLVPHAPYSVSENLWAAIQPYFQSKVATIHNQETVFEDELFLQNSGDFLRMYHKMKIDHSFFRPTGKSSLQSYFHQLKGAANILLVHNTFTKEADIVYANYQANVNKQRLYWCLCINANLYIESALPPIDLLMQHNSNIVLGTDSLASNWSLNIWDEIKSIQQHFPAIGLAELLRCATINGAKALLMDDKLGSFEKGKQPGVVLIANDQVKRII